MILAACICCDSGGVVLIGWALFYKKNLYFRFVLAAGGQVEKSKYSLGGALSDYTAVSPQISERLFQILQHKFLADVSNRIDTPTIGAYVPFLRKALETNPYLFIYLRFYAECLLECCAGRRRLHIMLESFLSQEVLQKHGEDRPKQNDLEPWAAWLMLVIFEDLEYRRTRAKGFLQFVFKPSASMQKYTDMQRFYILKTDKNSGIVSKFNVGIATLYDFERNATLGTVKTVFAESESPVVEEYEILNPDDMISLELFYTVKLRLPVKKCRCCGEFFVPSGRSDCEYCSRVNPVDGQRCSGVGAMKSYKESHAGDPVYKEYNKAYKRMHSKYRNAKLYDWEFKNWSKKARELRDRCQREGLSADQYKIMLEEIEI